MLDNWPDPMNAKDIAGFVAALRQVRTRTGLSFRTLERRAKRNGDVLPPSTVSAALSRDRLPRPDLVEAFVRACGGDEPTVAAWLAARADLAAGVEDEGATGKEEPVEPPEPVTRPRFGRRLGLRELAVGAAVVVVVGLVVAVPLLTDRAAPASGPTSSDRPVPTPSDVPADAIALAHTGLCVGEGPERKAGSTRPVLGQYDCASASPPISLEPVSPGVYRLKLLDVDKGPGCATVDGEGTLIEVLIAGEECEEGRLDQQFTFEPVDRPVAGYRLRSIPGARWCIGAYEGSHRPGTQLIQVPCNGHADQVFIVPQLS